MCQKCPAAAGGPVRAVLATTPKHSSLRHCADSELRTRQRQQRPRVPGVVRLGCARLTLPSPGHSPAASAHPSSWSDAGKRCSSKRQCVIPSCISIQKTLSSSSGESDCKVHKKPKHSCLLAGLYRELLHPSLYWEYLEYISSGVTHAVLSSLCCKS